MIFTFKFGMLQVRDNEISLRNWSGGTAQLCTSEGALMHCNAFYLWFESNENYRYQQQQMKNVGIGTKTFIGRALVKIYILIFLGHRT